MTVHTGVISLFALALAPAAMADVVSELESSGQATNNTVSLAQRISGGSFTANLQANVFGSLPTASVSGFGGGNDVDFYGFSTGGGWAYFDIDGAGGGAGGRFDTYLALFDAAGTLIADNDDSFPADAGSVSDLDAFLGAIDLRSGDYFIAVSSGRNTALASFSGGSFTELVRPDGEFGGFAFGGADAGDSRFARDGVQGRDAYTLHITIPAPASAGVLGLGGLVALRRRRR